MWESLKPQGNSEFLDLHQLSLLLSFQPKEGSSALRRLRLGARREFPDSTTAKHHHLSSGFLNCVFGESDALRLKMNYDLKTNASLRASLSSRQGRYTFLGRVQKTGNESAFGFRVRGEAEPWGRLELRFSRAGEGRDLVEFSLLKRWVGPPPLEELWAEARLSSLPDRPQASGLARLFFRQKLRENLRYSFSSELSSRKKPSMKIELESTELPGEVYRLSVEVGGQRGLPRLSVYHSRLLGNLRLSGRMTDDSVADASLKIPLSSSVDFVLASRAKMHSFSLDEDYFRLGVGLLLNF